MAAVSGNASLRITLPDTLATPATVHHVVMAADATVGELRTTVASKMVVERGELSGCCRGVFEIVNDSYHPATVLAADDDAKTLQALGMWPGGSIVVRPKPGMGITGMDIGVGGPSTTAAAAAPGGGGSSGGGYGSAGVWVAVMPKPSELLVEHVDRHKDATPLGAEKTKFQVRGSAEAAAETAAASGAASKQARVAAEKAAGARSKSGKKVSGQVRRMLIKQQAVGRETLDQVTSGNETTRFSLGILRASNERHFPPFSPPPSLTGLVLLFQPSPCATLGPIY
jgi:hypothetical protein